jgi:hypothetical protein
MFPTSVDLCSCGGGIYIYIYIYIYVVILLPRRWRLAVIAFLFGVVEKFALKLLLEVVLLMIMVALKFHMP